MSGKIRFILPNIYFTNLYSTFTFFWIFLLICQNKIKHHSVTNHIYENITQLETFGVMKIIVKFLNISIYVILDSTLLSFALLWMFWFWQLTTHKRVKLCHVINMYANMSKDQQCTAYISILLLKFLPVKKTPCICVIILKYVQYVLYVRRTFQMSLNLVGLRSL